MTGMRGLPELLPNGSRVRGHVPALHAPVERHVAIPVVGRLKAPRPHYIDYHNSNFTQLLNFCTLLGIPFPQCSTDCPRAECRDVNCVEEEEEEEE